MTILYKALFETGRIRRISGTVGSATGDDECTQIQGCFNAYTNNGQPSGTLYNGAVVEEGEQIYGSAEPAPAPRSGRYCYRTEMRNGDRYPDNCGGSSGKVRVEINNLVRRESSPELHWIGFSTFVPLSWPGNTKKHIMQQSGPQKGVAVPKLLIDGDLFRVGLNSGNVPGYSAQIVKGQWHDWVYHFRFTSSASANNGFCKVWHNGQLVLNAQGWDYWNQNSQNRFSGHMAKWGLYADAPPTTPLVIYHDNFRVGDGTSSYAEVDPAQGGGEPPPPPPPTVDSVFIKFDNDTGTTGLENYELGPDEKA